MLVNTKPFFVVSEAIPANLSMGDETCPGVASPVTFTLSINDAPNGLASFGFRIAYDNAILTYGSFSNIVGVSGLFVSDQTTYLQVSGYDFSSTVPTGFTGTFMTISFTTISCTATTLVLSNTIDDMSGWTLKAGNFA